MRILKGFLSYGVVFAWIFWMIWVGMAELCR